MVQRLQILKVRMEALSKIQPSHRYPRGSLYRWTVSGRLEISTSKIGMLRKPRVRRSLVPLDRLQSSTMLG